MPRSAAIVLLALVGCAGAVPPQRLEPRATCGHAARRADACVTVGECYLMRDVPDERRVEFLRCACP